LGFKSFISGKLGKGGKELSDLSKAMLVTGAGGQAKQSLPDIEMRKLLGINRDMIKDDWVLGFLEAQSLIPIQVKDQQGKLHDVMRVNWDIAALRICASPVNRTSIIGKNEAELIKLINESIVDLIELQMDEDEYELGQTNALDAINVYLRFAVNDAYEGKKANLLKTIQTATRYEIGEAKEGKKAI